MTHEIRKVAKIVEELTVYFFALGAGNIQSGIERKENDVVITFSADYHPDYEEDLHSLEEYLNGQKCDGIEDIYWELAGSGDPGETSQLLLVGMMIDRAEIKQGQGSVRLRLFKKLLD